MKANEAWKMTERARPIVQERAVQERLAREEAAKREQEAQIRRDNELFNKTIQSIWDRISSAANSGQSSTTIDWDKISSHERIIRSLKDEGYAAEKDRRICTRGSYDADGAFSGVSEYYEPVLHISWEK